MDHRRFFYTAAPEPREKCDRAKCQNTTRGDESTVNETSRAVDNEFSWRCVISDRTMHNGKALIL
jgi:hypothetical protein